MAFRFTYALIMALLVLLPMVLGNAEPDHYNHHKPQHSSGGHHYGNGGQYGNSGHHGGGHSGGGHPGSSHHGGGHHGGGYHH